MHAGGVPAAANGTVALPVPAPTSDAARSPGAAYDSASETGASGQPGRAAS